MAYGDYVRHQAVVTAWLSKAEKGLDNEQLVDLLELTLTRVMDAARLPAGEITLAAVLDRVVGTAADAFQWLPRTVVTAGAADFSAFRAAAPRLQRQNVLRAVHFVLTDFLAILGNLTAEVLTPELHKQLDSVRLKKTRNNHRGKRK